MVFLNYINGLWQPAQSQKTMEKFSPFDGSLLGEVALSEAMDVVLSLVSSKKSLAAYEKTSLEERAALLRRISEALSERAFEVASLEALHQGLPVDFVLEHSVSPAITIFSSLAGSLGEGASLGILRPTGLLAIIATWNLSLRSVAERLAPALAAGNAVILKPSPLSPVTGQILGEIFSQVSLPPGLVNILHGGEEVTQTLAAHPSVQAVSMVGRSGNVEKVIEAATGTLKKLQVLGGAKNAALVLGDADFRNWMPQIVRPFLLGQGQLGQNISRLFILESQQKEFLEVLVSYLESLRPASSPRANSDWTPLISSEAVRDTLNKLAMVKADQGKLIFGGDSVPGPGFFMRPLVTLNLSNCSTLQQDELHGPLLIVTPVKYQHEMVKWVNTSYLAQSAVIWGSEEKALKLAEQLDVAEVSLNEWPSRELDPVGGNKQSSYGIQDYRWNGFFFSRAKKLTGAFKRQ